jgi:hypothetical protein
MPDARIHPPRYEPRRCLPAQGEPDDRRIATDGGDAVYVAMRVLAEQHELLIGDRLTVEADAASPVASLTAQQG